MIRFLCALAALVTLGLAPASAYNPGAFTPDTERGPYTPFSANAPAACSNPSLAPSLARAIHYMHHPTRQATRTTPSPLPPMLSTIHRGAPFPASRPLPSTVEPCCTTFPPPIPAVPNPPATTEQNTRTAPLPDSVSQAPDNHHQAGAETQPPQDPPNDNTATAASQSGDVTLPPGARQQIVPFLEGTDVFWTWRRRDEAPGLNLKWPYYLEANIFSHLIVHQNFTNVVQVSPRGKLRDGWSISGTPAVRIRMFREQSNPVRTPSYMPRVNIQFFRPWSNRGDVRIEAPSEAPVVHILETHFILGHHSNGQDGCLTTDQSRRGPDDECSPRRVPVTAATVNRRNGGFSTNYWRTGITYSRNHWTERNPEPYTAAASEMRLRLDFEHHFQSDPDIVGYYSADRVGGGFALAYRGVRACERRLEVSVDVVWNVENYFKIPRGSVSGQFSCFGNESGGWGWFVRWYKGQDYYNLGFVDSIHRLHVGITFTQADFFRIVLPSRPGRR